MIKLAGIVLAGFFFAGMTAERKTLYRELLWWAMVDMRNHSANAVDAVSSLLGGYRRSYRVVNRFVFEMNQWLHNAALYSSVDFDGFEEALFWQDYQRFRSRYPADRWAVLTEAIVEKLQRSE